MQRLKQAMMLLIANEQPLGAQWKDHPLKGPWGGYRECHIGGDFLLVYKLTDDDGSIIFTAAGTHSDLFG
jgi:mRNA interferase YafQ